MVSREKQIHVVPDVLKASEIGTNVEQWLQFDHWFQNGMAHPWI